MNKLFNELSIVIALLVCMSLFSGVASATHLSCSSQIGATVATQANSLISGTPSGFECNDGGLQFDQFFMNAGTTQAVKLSGVNFGGGAVSLSFQLDPTLSSTNGFTFFYRVTGFQAGFTVGLGGTPVSYISEEVCSVPFQGMSGVCPLGNLIGKYTATTNQSSGFVAFQVPVNQAYFKLDLSVNGSGAFAEFDHGHEIPEPGTYAMMGAGLIGLAFLKRKRTNS
jgi:hypothetical protein